MDKLTLQHDLTIPAGTVFECIDGVKREYHNNNFEATVCDGNDRLIKVCLQKDSSYFKEK